ncbi:hypothetical protein Hanom_Chr04g00374011 [Helianthus anomalus]
MGSSQPVYFQQMVSSIGTGLKFTKSVYFRYRFCTVIHRFLPSNTGAVPVPTGTEPYHTRYIRYRYPLLGISVTGTVLYNLFFKLKLEWNTSLRNQQMVSVIGTGLKFTKSVYFRYRFFTGIHRFLPSNTGTVPVPTGTEPYHTRYIRYRYPLLRISVTVFLVPSSSNLVATQQYK